MNAVIGKLYIHKVSGVGARNAKSLLCFRCGGMGHIASDCKFDRRIVCYACGKSGHIRRACRSSTSTQQHPSTSHCNQSYRSPTQRHIRQVNEDLTVDSTDIDSTEEELFQVKASTSASPAIMIDGSVGWLPCCHGG